MRNGRDRVVPTRSHKPFSTGDQATHLISIAPHPSIPTTQAAARPAKCQAHTVLRSPLLPTPASLASTQCPPSRAKVPRWTPTRLRFPLAHNALHSTSAAQPTGALGDWGLWRGSNQLLGRNSRNRKHSKPTAPATACRPSYLSVLDMHLGLTALHTHTQYTYTNLSRTALDILKRRNILQQASSRANSIWLAWYLRGAVNHHTHTHPATRLP